MLQKLIYVAPAEDVRDIFSAYYYAEFPPDPIIAHERAAIAQIRFVFEGSVIAIPPTGIRFHADRALIYGPTTGQTQYEITEGLRFIGSGLLPCGWHAITRRSAADYLNTIIPIDEEFCPTLSGLPGRLAAADGLEAMVALLDEWARSVDRFVDPDVRQFVHMVDHWLISAIAPELDDLHGKTSLSRRHVERLVKNLYGVPPKVLARKYRALRTAKLLHATNAASEDYAYAFYDQSHMIRELKHFTGQTPKEIRFDVGEVTRILDQRSDLAGRIHPLTALT